MGRGFWTVYVFFLPLFFAYVECNAKENHVTPCQFGLLEAKTDQERYWCLYQTHIEAKRTNSKVVYDSIDTIRIEIPKDAKPIPLTDETDFGNAVFIVNNQKKDLYLFYLSNIVTKDFYTSYYDIERKKSINEKGNYLIVVEDKNPWVQNREGFNYGHIRKDIVFINEGRVKGNVISSYGTISSNPVFSKIVVNKAPKYIKNIQFIRDSSSTFKTFPFYIENQYNVYIDNVYIYTPKGDLYGDAAIRLINCFKVNITDVTIDGTYSQLDTYGYGISMDNVSNVSIERLNAKACWGVFGNNNINNIRLKNCDINRFDVHCYGKDVYCTNCIFRDLYNQFSSMFGTVSFKKCEFLKSTPVLFEASYNAYTKFKLVIKDCVVHASEQRFSLIHGGDINGEITAGREELKQKSFPDLYIDGLTVFLPRGVKNYYTYNLKRQVLKWPQDNIPGLKKYKRFKIVLEN